MVNVHHVRRLRCHGNRVCLLGHHQRFICGSLWSDSVFTKNELIFNLQQYSFYQISVDIEYAPTKVRNMAFWMVQRSLCVPDDMPLVENLVDVHWQSGRFVLHASSTRLGLAAFLGCFVKIWPLQDIFFILTILMWPKMKFSHYFITQTFKSNNEILMVKLSLEDMCLVLLFFLKNTQPFALTSLTLYLAFSVNEGLQTVS